MKPARKNENKTKTSPVFKTKTFVRAPRKEKILPPSTLKPGFERLEKYLAQQGLASRREAKDLIKRGLVLVNDRKVYEPGFGINPERDHVAVDGGKMPEKESVLLYKPRNVETNATTPGVTDIKMRFPKYAHLSPIGRLDKDSGGLIILSNDGTLAKALTKENSNVEKEYLVSVREEVIPEALNRLAHGIKLDHVMTKPAVVKRVGRNGFTIILKEGRKHQIRRMCDACHLTITSLVRIRIGHLESKKMIAGNAKSIAPKDVLLLKK